MARSVLFQAHHLPFVILDKLFAMSKGFVFLTFELILVGMALLSDSSAGSTFVDRLTRGDMFRNLPRNTSSDCLAKGARCTIRLGGTVGDKICEKNCCFCRCDNDKPTFLVQERRCVEEKQLLRILEKQGKNEGCDYRFVVAAGTQQPPTCKQKVLIAIDNTKGARNYSMKFCSWRSFDVHQFVVNGITDCSIVPSESFYLFNETWFNMWAPDTATNQAVFKVHVEGKNTSDADILLEWTKDLPAVYAGLIFSLKLRCYKNNETINSCLFSKNRGTFNGSKPTFYPPTTLLSSTTAATRSKTTASPTITTEPNTNISVLEQNMKEEEELNVLVLVLAIVGALLLFILLCVSLLLLVQRRRRGDIEKFEPRENPMYQKGPSVSLKLKEIEEGDEKTSLPFIINDESHDQQNGVPASHRRAHGSSAPKGPVQQKGPSASDPDMYQSLITEGVIGGDYQVLLDDGQIEDQPDEDVHEYHVLESDGGTSDSDSYSMETPPSQNRNIVKTENNLLDDLLDDIHDYDEPDDIYEVREPTNGVNRDTNKIVAEERSGDNKSARLSGYDEPEIVVSDEECDNTETVRPEELPSTTFNPHDYAEPDA